MSKNALSTKIVMMTGDSEKTAKAIADKVGVDEYYSEVLPEDKAKYVEKEKLSGRKVIMIGDGINDSPALSAADVGIAINDGAEIAKEIADKHGYTLVGEIADVRVDRITQNQERDLSFLTKLAEQYGYIFKIAENNLVFYDVQKLKGSKPTQIFYKQE